MTRKDLRTYRYQRLRAAFLTGKTRCHWCGKFSPRLTIDHLVPVALMQEGAGLTPLSVENWVAACLSCNARRGAQLANGTRHRNRRPAAGYSASSQWPPPSREW